MGNKKLSNLNNRLGIKILVVLIIFFVLVIYVSEINIINDVERYSSLEDFTAYLDERIPALMEDYDIPGVNIALVQKGKMTWSKAYGYADIEEGRKMTTDTYCRVQSISKSVTAWGVMKLVGQGKIELDKPIKQYIKNWEFPESKFAVEKVTVRQLLSHTAGMPLGSIGVHYPPQGDIPSLEENLYKEASLIQEPGASFLYSNVGFNLLELLIEEVTGQKFAKYMEKEVLKPLGMKNSSFSWSEGLNPEVPVGYDLKQQPVPVYVYPEKASGGLFASVEDIARFVAAGMPNYYTDNKVISHQNINKLYTEMTEIEGIYNFVSDSYGLGYFIENLPDGRKAVFHGGQGHGIMTHFHSIPDTGDGIVILTNSQRSWPFIAYILSDWSKWCGFSSVGMGKIVIAQKVLWVFVGMALVISLWQVFRLGFGIVTGKRQFTPLMKEFKTLRLVQSALSIILLFGLLWCINQDYLFISSVFPVLSIWLGFLVFISAITLLLSSLFSCISKEKENC